MSRFPTTAPLGTVPAPWRFPRMASQDLANGLRVAAIHVPTLPLVQARWVFGSGRVHEGMDKLGAGLMLQRVMRHGSVDVPAAQFVDSLDRLGARMGGGVSIDSSVVSVSGLSTHLWRFVDLATEVALRPGLPDIAVAAERFKAQAVHRHEWSKVDTMAELWLARALYGDHPYGRPRTTASGLSRIGRDDLAEMHASIVDPSRGMFLVVGKVDADAVVQRLAQRFDSIAAGGRVAVNSVSEPKSPAHSVKLIPEPTAESCVIGLGLPAVSRDHPEHTALRVVNQIFGGSASSRLFRELRDKRGLSYGAYSTLDCGRSAGDITASISVSPESAIEAFDVLYDTLGSLCSVPATDDELSHAKRFLVGSFPQRASGVAGLASLATAAWLHGLSDDVWSTTAARIEAVDGATVRATAASWFKPDSSTWVMVGPPHTLSAMESTLETKGLTVSYGAMSELEAISD